MLHLIKLFMTLLLERPLWHEAVEAGICSIPLSEDWESRRFITPFVPVWTRQNYNFYLTMHLMQSGMLAFPINPPVVPQGTGRVRLVIHAANTEDQVRLLVDSICVWAQEMIDIERRTKTGVKAPRRRAQTLRRNDRGRGTARGQTSKDRQPPHGLAPSATTLPDSARL